MQYLLTQEELDARDAVAKKEFGEKRMELVKYVQKLIQWAARQSVMGETPAEVMDRMFREVGKPPE